MEVESKMISLQCPQGLEASAGKDLREGAPAVRHNHCLLLQAFLYQLAPYRKK